MQRPECSESKSSKAVVKKPEGASPKNQSSSGLGWFKKLQHKLKFKNQIHEECTPVESKSSEAKEGQHPPVTTPSDLQPLSLTSLKG
ncbi:unnamed protein product [Sphagnum balticum]